MKKRTPPCQALPPPERMKSLHVTMVGINEKIAGLGPIRILMTMDGGEGERARSRATEILRVSTPKACWETLDGEV